MIKTTGKTERKPVVDLAKTKLPKNGVMPRKKNMRSHSRGFVDLHHLGSFCIVRLKEVKV